MTTQALLLAAVRKHTPTSTLTSLPSGNTCTHKGTWEKALTLFFSWQTFLSILVAFLCKAFSISPMQVDTGADEPSHSIPWQRAHSVGIWVYTIQTQSNNASHPVQIEMFL